MPTSGAVLFTVNPSLLFETVSVTELFSVNPSFFDETIPHSGATIAIQNQS